jgi:hypothetical protein
VALSSDALIQDLTVVRDYIGEPDAAARKLEPIVDGVSKTITTYTQRQFWPDPEPVLSGGVDASVPEAKKFRYDGAGYLSLAPYECREVEPNGVQMFTDWPQENWWTMADPTPTQFGMYRLEPRNRSPEGTYLWLSLLDTLQFGQTLTSGMLGESMPLSQIGGLEVTVTGRWGMLEPAPEAVLALLVTVDALWKNPEGYASRTLGGLAVATLPFTSLPAEAQALLQGLKRRRIG